jgi:hypothetical protein
LLPFQSRRWIFWFIAIGSTPKAVNQETMSVHIMPTQIAASHLSKTGDYTIPQGMEDKADLMFEVVLPQKFG